MELDSRCTVIRVRIAASHWHELKRRALTRSRTPAEYAQLIFAYPVHERSVVFRPRSMDDPDEEIYVSVPVNHRIRAKLTAGSAEHQTSVAVYAGLLLCSFLQHYDTDPRDLRMMQFVADRLHETPILSELDLLQAIEHCEMNRRVRLPPGFFAKWLHGRLQPLIAAIDRAGESLDFTVDLVDEVLGRTGRH
jgi:hypothetical protein